MEKSFFGVIEWKSARSYSRFSLESISAGKPILWRYHWWPADDFAHFNVVDDYNLEALAIELNLNLTSKRVIRVLDRISLKKGYPSKMRMDNGLKLNSTKVAELAEEYNLDLEIIQPKKPIQNSFVECFNRTFYTEVLYMHDFRNLYEVREISRNWFREFN